MLLHNNEIMIRAQSSALLDRTTSCDRRRLFVDFEDVERSDHIRQTVCQARKHPLNPVLRVGMAHEPDGGRCSPWPTRSVVYDARAKRFRAWCYAIDRGFGGNPDGQVAYVESGDGIRWTKPKLGLFDIKGQAGNNLLPEPARGCSCFFLDEAERDPARRFKAPGWVEGPIPGKHVPGLCYSADGLTWTRGEALSIKGMTGRICDPVAFLRDDQEPDPKRRWKLIWQDYASGSKPGPEMVRHKYLAFGPQPHRLTVSRLNPFISPNTGREQEIHFLAYFPYEGLWLSPYEYGFYHPNGLGTFGQYGADIRLMASRDGERFERVCPDEPLIARGPRGSWDAGFLVITQAPVYVGDEIWFYYAGLGEEWSAWPPGNNPCWPEARGPARYSRDEMGLAILRRDGFACVQTADRVTSGSLETKTVKVARKDADLIVNLGDTADGRDWMEVEVLDARTGRALPGFGRGDCDDLTVDSVRAKATWRGKSLSTALRKAGAAIRLRFWLHGAVRFYSYRFAKSNNQREPANAIHV